MLKLQLLQVVILFNTVTVVFPLNRNAFGTVENNAAAAGNGIKLTNAIGNYDVGTVAGAEDVASLVTALDGNTNLGAGTTVTAARDSYNESQYEVSWTTSATGVAATASATGTVYFTYGTDPLTGAAIVGTTGEHYYRTKS